MRRWLRRFVVFLSLIPAIGLAAGGCLNYQFPYGWSHCCDIGIYLELLLYAEKHDGWFPKGEATPEASLSLLAREDPGMTYWLCGKTLPVAAAKAQIDAGLLLTPETCDWHYVEGLRQKDDSRLALFWDKVGLGHNGQRLGHGGHIVTFLNGNKEYIPGNKWHAFLIEQEQLLAERKKEP